MMTENTPRFDNGYALLVGVGNYPHVSPLPVTVNDATALYKLLTARDRAGYPENQVKLLVNEAASVQGILDGLDWLIDCSERDPLATVILYFSGHGGVTGRGDYLLAPYEFTWSNRKTAILKEVFAGKVDRIKARKLLVLLDCCHAAGIATKSSLQNDFQPSNEALYQRLRAGSGRVVVASSRHDQYSRILPNARYSVFTDALIQALDVDGGDNSDHATVFRTLAYVSETVKKETKDLQIPVFQAEKLEDFAICRIDKELATRRPFRKSAAYLGTDQFHQQQEANMPEDLMTLTSRLLDMLDDQGFAAVPIVLEAIRRSGRQYNKPAFANLRNDGLTNLALLSPNDYIIRLKIFIGMIA